MFPIWMAAMALASAKSQAAAKDREATAQAIADSSQQANSGYTGAKPIASRMLASGDFQTGAITGLAGVAAQQRADEVQDAWGAWLKAGANRQQSQARGETSWGEPQKPKSTDEIAGPVKPNIRLQELSGAPAETGSWGQPKPSAQGDASPNWRIGPDGKFGYYPDSAWEKKKTGLESWGTY